MCIIFSLNFSYFPTHDIDILSGTNNIIILNINSFRSLTNYITLQNYTQTEDDKPGTGIGFIPMAVMCIIS